MTDNPCELKRLIAESLLKQLNLCRENTTFRSSHGISSVDTARKDIAIALIDKLAEIAKDCGKQCCDAAKLNEVHP